MMLVDANLLLYAKVADSPQHTRARPWHEARLSGPKRLGLPWPRLLAFVCLITNPRLFDTPLRMEQAWGQVQEWLGLSTVWVAGPTERHAEILGRLPQSTNVVVPEDRLLVASDGVSHAQIDDWCRRHRHRSIKEQHAALYRRVRGHCNSFGVRGNSNRVMRRVEDTKRAWYKGWCRRSQRTRLNWERFSDRLRWWPLPRPRITVRMWDGSPRATSTEEPDGGNLPSSGSGEGPGEGNRPAYSTSHFFGLDYGVGHASRPRARQSKPCTSGKTLQAPLIDQQK